MEYGVQLPRNTALLVVDVQVGTDHPGRDRRNNWQAEENIDRLLAAWRGSERPVYHVRHNSRSVHSPFHNSKPGNAIMEFAQPIGAEPLIEKDVNCAFVGTDLERRLREAGIDTLVIAGFSTDHCVESTARMAGDLLFDTYVVSDATATFDRVGPDGTLYEAAVVHGVSLASMDNEFCTIVDTNSLLAAVDAFAPAEREIQ